MAGMGVALGQTSAPKSVEQITEQAQDYDFDANVPLRYWLRTAGTLLQQAQRYLAEHDDEIAYFLLFRHAHLVLSNLTAHPQAKDPICKAILAEHNREVNNNFDKLDALKPKIKERYERYIRLMAEREARRLAQELRVLQDGSDFHDNESRYSVPRVRQLQPSENKDLAMWTAQRELSRRAATNPSQLSTDGDDLSKRLQAIRSQVEPDRQPSLRHDIRPQDSDRRSSSYNYPSVPSKHINQQQDVPLIPPPRTSSFEQPFSPPVLPPKPSFVDPQAPARPDKVSIELPKRVTTPHDETSFAPAAFLENGEALRTVFLPPTLRTTFLRIAHQNTMANLETCAFLAGFLSRNAFFVSKLVVPAQTATPDTCEMTNESQLFDYVDSEDLMILGWIHTHPSQTCFMSSRDLHTHSGYQVMLAESVAIVCAPSKGDTAHGGDWGVFRLTDPPGKKAILECKLPGIFHPHDVENVYTGALRPGHVMELTDMKFEVVDLRN